MQFFCETCQRVTPVRTSCIYCHDSFLITDPPVRRRDIPTPTTNTPSHTSGLTPINPIALTKTSDVQTQPYSHGKTEVISTTPSLLVTIRDPLPDRFGDAHAKVWAGTLAASEVEKALGDDENLKVRRRTLAGESQPEHVALQNGLEGVFKKEVIEDSEVALWEWGGTPNNEVAAYLLAKELGLKMVPVTIWRSLQGKSSMQKGSFQLFVGGMETGNPTSETDYPPDAFLFDKLIGNSDRKSDNLGRKVIEDTAVPVLIDNAVAFPPNASLALNSTEQAKMRRATEQLKLAVTSFNESFIDSLPIAPGAPKSTKERLKTIRSILAGKL
jgi:hypothetical protein